MLAYAVVANVAGATDTWTTPYPGVRQLTRVNAGERVVALAVDLCARGVAVRATKSTEAMRTPSSFRALVGAQAAINGAPFQSGVPRGLALGDGEAWGVDDDQFGWFAAGPDRVAIDLPEHVLESPEGWMKQAVGGDHLLVDDGVAESAFGSAGCSTATARSAVGLSLDRQTLWLVAIEGGAATGKTCAEAAELLVELGAYDALALDGGASTSLSLESGLAVAPSGGAEAIVANHLAVIADGVGAPAACDLWMDEAIVDAAALSGTSSTDMNGDGKADLCARAAVGWRCYPSTGAGFGAAVATTALSDADGWNDESNRATIRVGDVTGDGRADLCARADAGVVCWPSTGTGWGTSIAGPLLSDATGWNAPEYFTTLRLSDVTGDGREDVCARGKDGLRCWPSTGAGFGEALLGPAWTDEAGWSAPDRYGTIRTGDVNGDGRQDVCGRGPDGMACALSTGDELTDLVAGPAWSDAAGFTDVRYWSTIRLVDLDGDGRADLCARTSSGIECSFSTGTGFGAPVVGPALTDASGWGDLDNATTLRFGDLDGDGRTDLCARANAGIRCWRWLGGAFGPSINGPSWSDAAGWDDLRNYPSIDLADLDGDGRADVCGRAPDGVRCARFNGTAFAAEIATGLLTDASGWAGAPYAGTLRFSGPRCAPKLEVCNGVDDDCDGVADDGPAGGGVPCTTIGLGICAAGVSACVSGKITCKPIGAAMDEVCNGLDDDCDGETDDGDPGGGDTCTLDAPPPCDSGHLHCSSGSVACTVDPPAAPEDADCDSLDDDCDGHTDEDFVGAIVACGVPPCDAVGVIVCVDGSTQVSCTPPDGAPCPTGTPCLADGVCQEGVCTPGGPKPGACDDGDSCTTDLCESGVGCSHAPVSGSCEDGDACTSGDSCSTGGCVAGAQVDCDDHNPCTHDACNSAVGCTYAPAAAACDDVDPCTETVCDEGSCEVSARTPGCCSAGTSCSGPDARCVDGECEPATCEPCDDDSACGAARCLSVAPGRACAVRCDSDAVCPLGTRCQPLPDGNACLPESGNCCGDDVEGACSPPEAHPELEWAEAEPDPAMGDDVGAAADLGTHEGDGIALADASSTHAGSPGGCGVGGRGEGEWLMLLAALALARRRRRFHARAAMRNMTVTTGPE